MKSSKDEILAYVFEDIPDDEQDIQSSNDSEPKSTMSSNLAGNNLSSPDSSRKAADLAEGPENLWLQSEMNGE